MQEAVLVPLDGSEAAERAIALAVAIAARADALLRLVHVHVRTSGPGASLPIDAYRLEFESMEDAEAYLSSLLDRLQASAPGVVTADLIRGSVLETLVHEIRKREVGLVVMTTHGTSGLRGAAMGSVATRIIQEARTPVLVMGPAVTAGMARTDGDPILDVEVANIAVALDGSEASARILPAATKLARWFGARITLMAVAPGTRAGTTTSGGSSATAGAESRGSELAAYLDRMADSLAQQGLPAHRRLVRSDDVAGAILRAAAEEGADVVAMTTHARAPQSGLGSVAAAVVSASRIPVLLYRPAG